MAEPSGRAASPVIRLLDILHGFATSRPGLRAAASPQLRCSLWREPSVQGDRDARSTRRGGSALRRRRPSVGGAPSAPRPPTPLARSAARVSPPLPLSRNLQLTTLPNYSYPSLSSQRRCQGWRGFRSEPLLPCRHLRGHQASGFSPSEPPGHQLPTAAERAARRRGHDPRAPAPGDCSGAGVPGTLPAPWASERLSKKGRRDPHPLGRLPLGSPRSAPRLQPFSQIQLGSRELSRSCSHPDPT